MEVLSTYLLFSNSHSHLTWENMQCMAAWFLEQVPVTMYHTYISIDLLSSGEMAKTHHLA